MCWLRRASDATQVSNTNEVYLYGEIIGSFVLSLHVLLFPVRAPPTGSHVPGVLLIVWVLDTEFWDRQPLLGRSRGNSMDQIAIASLLHREENDILSGLYNENRRVATAVYNNEHRCCEKLVVADYAPQIFQNTRKVCGIDNVMYEQSFADALWSWTPSILVQFNHELCLEARRAAKRSAALLEKQHDCVQHENKVRDGERHLRLN
ncbi:hypothetical protein FI667_g11403, partial [Globisporangium splendens]